MLENSIVAKLVLEPERNSLQGIVNYLEYFDQVMTYTAGETLFELSQLQT
jgi:chromosome condensin MukBEF MukE localization factor